MERSTWIFIGGTAIAAMVLVAGELDMQRLKAKAGTRSMCDANFLWDVRPAPTADQIARWPAECRTHLAEERAAIQAGPWSQWPAAIIVILSLVPWAWNFLIRRIAELRAAIGKPPAG